MDAVNDMSRGSDDQDGKQTLGSHTKIVYMLHAPFAQKIETWVSNLNTP
jgi:hypothetical protein